MKVLRVFFCAADGRQEMELFLLFFSLYPAVHNNINFANILPISFQRKHRKICANKAKMKLSRTTFLSKAVKRCFVSKRKKRKKMLWTWFRCWTNEMHISYYTISHIKTINMLITFRHSVCSSCWWLKGWSEEGWLWILMLFPSVINLVLSYVCTLEFLIAFNVKFELKN